MSILAWVFGTVDAILIIFLLGAVVWMVVDGFRGFREGK